MFSAFFSGGCDGLRAGAVGRGLIGDVRARRWVERSAGKGVRARWAERRLFRAAAEGDQVAVQAVAEIAGRSGHRCGDAAKRAVAGWWVESRDPVLRQVVLKTGAFAEDWPGRVLCAALLGRLGELNLGGDAGYVAPLVHDPDPVVRASAEDFHRTARGMALRMLWLEGLGRSLLLQNPEPPGQPMLRDLWEEWKAAPSDELWRALTGWGLSTSPEPDGTTAVIAIGADPSVLREPRYRTALIEAIALGDHPLSEIASAKFLLVRDQMMVEELCQAALRDPHLAWFCVRHGFAPAMGVDRAVFLLVTGQKEPLREWDPDGRLLTHGYATLNENVRTAIRDAMRAGGHHDPVRIVAGTDRGSVSPGEASYLAEFLADREDWAALWDLVRDVPLRTGTELMRFFNGWSPPDEDRRLFEMYLETDPRRVETALARMADGWPLAERRATIWFAERVNDLSFAPDAPLLAVANARRAVGVVDLGAARLTERYRGFEASVGHVLHVGNGALVAGERTNEVGRACRIMWCAGGEAVPLHTARGSVTSLALTGDDGAFAAGTRSGRLVLGAAGGGSVRTRSVTSLGLPNGDWPRMIAAHRGSGRIALLGRRTVLVDPKRRGPLASDRSARSGAVLAIEDVLLCADRDGWITRLDAGRHSFHEEASVLLHRLAGIAAAPEPDRLIAVDETGDLHFFDPWTLQHHGALPGSGRPTNLTVSPDGALLAVVRDEDRADLYDLRVGELPRIAERPIAHLVPRHLRVVAGVRASGELSPEVRDAVALLHACLEHRFGRGGVPTELSTGEYDVAL